MPNYFARVELHDAIWPDDYEDLHERLARIGFTPCIFYTKGGSKKLPTAFYFARGLGGNTESVAQTVFNAARETGFEHEVTVIKSGGSVSRLRQDCD